MKADPALSPIFRFCDQDCTDLDCYTRRSGPTYFRTEEIIKVQSGPYPRWEAKTALEAFNRTSRCFSAGECVLSGRGWHCSA